MDNAVPIILQWAIFNSISLDITNCVPTALQPIISSGCFFLQSESKRNLLLIKSDSINNVFKKCVLVMKQYINEHSLKKDRSIVESINCE